MPSPAPIPVPLADLRAQYTEVRDEVEAAVARVSESGRYVLGPEVEAFEREIAALTGVAHAVGVSSGTDALLVSLLALGTGPGDEVVLPAFSFFATAEVVARLGARPVFADVEAASLNLDPACAIAALGPRTRAVIPVHLFGRCAELDALGAACAERGVPIVEDAAQAIGAVDPQGRPAGGVGLCGCFSFFPTKNLGAMGEGGMVATADGALAIRLQLLRQHGSHPRHVHAVLGGNFRLDALQAAILRAKLPHLGRWTAARAAHAHGYRERFAAAGLDGLVEAPAPSPGHAWNQFVVRVPERDRLREALEREGIGTEVYYPVPLPHQPVFRALGHRWGEFPVAEDAAARVLALPVHPHLRPEQQDHVVGAIARFYGL